MKLLEWSLNAIFFESFKRNLDFLGNIYRFWHANGIWEPFFRGENSSVISQLVQVTICKS